MSDKPFDPDAFLEETKKPAAPSATKPFDPDAFLGAEPPPTGPGAGEAFARGGAQGATLGFGDELLGAVQALGAKHPVAGAVASLLNPGAALASLPLALRLAATVSSGRPLKEAFDDAAPGRGMLDVYRGARDAERSDNAAAESAHPAAYVGGNLAGGLVTAPLLPGGAAVKGSAGLARALALAKVGGALGAASGLGGSKADVTRGELGGAARDTATGGAVGAVVGTALPMAGGLAKRALRAGSEALEGTAINAGRRVLTGGANLINGNKKMVSPEAVEKAFEAGAFKPLGTTGGAAERLGVAKEMAGQRYGDILKELEAAGVEGPARARLQEELGGQGQALIAEGKGFNPAVPGEWFGAADQLGNVATRPSGNVPLGFAENFKRSAQNTARSQYAKIGSAVSDVGDEQMAIARALREANEGAISQQTAKAPEAAAAFAPAKDEYRWLAEAQEAAEKGANQKARRSHFGLSEHLAAAGEDSALKKALAAIGMGELKARGPSTAAWGAMKGSDLLGALGGNLSPAQRQMLMAAALRSASLGTTSALDGQE